MIPREANVFLTKAALLDPRMKRVNPEEQADMASMWAEVLEDVPLADALVALTKHYRAESIPIMPSHVLAAIGMHDDTSTLVDITDQVVAESKARALAAAGVSEAEFEAHQHDAAWIRQRFAARELETTDESGTTE